MRALDQRCLLGAVALGATVVACGAPIAGPRADLPVRPAASASAAASSAAAPAVDVTFEPAAPTAEQLAADEARATELQWVLAAHENRNPLVTPAGDRVVYRSTRGGDMAIYVGQVARPEIAPRRLWPCPGGCDLLEISAAGDWASLRLGPPTAPPGTAVHLRIAGGPPELDESASRRPVGPQTAPGTPWQQTPPVGPCGTALPVAAPALRAELGSVGVLQGSPDALTWESPLTPADLWRYDQQRGVLRPLRNEVRPGLAALGDVRLVVDGSAAVVALVPRGSIRAVLLVAGSSPQPVAGWDPVARALAGRGYAVVRGCRAKPAPDGAVLRWLDEQAFAAGRPRAVVIAGAVARPALRALVASPSVATAVAASWWWADDPIEPSPDSSAERSALWRRALRLAALERVLGEVFQPFQLQGGVD